jgi:molybdopterin-binding protein
MKAIADNSVYLHQSPYLFRGSVFHNMKMAAPGIGYDPIDSALDALGLNGFQHRRAGKLSGGETKRVALARCLLANSTLLLLDEPTAHADSSSASLIEQCCREQAAKGRAVIVTSHRGGFGYRIADRIVDLADGKIRESHLNLLKGQVVRKDDGHMQFRSDDANFRVPLRDGEFRVAVLDGRDILLSVQPLESSARNSIKGTLTAVVQQSDDTYSINIDCGIPLKTVVTDSSVGEFDLKIGRTVYVTFKASSVALY